MAVQGRAVHRRIRGRRGGALMGCAGVMGNRSGDLGVGLLNTALTETVPCLTHANLPHRRRPNPTACLSSSSAVLSSRWGLSPISSRAVPCPMGMADRPLSASRTTRLRLRQPSRPHPRPRQSLRRQPSLHQPSLHQPSPHQPSLSRLRLPRQRPLRPDTTLSFLITASGGHSVVPAVCMSGDCPC